MNTKTKNSNGLSHTATGDSKDLFTEAKNLLKRCGSVGEKRLMDEIGFSRGDAQALMMVLVKQGFATPLDNPSSEYVVAWRWTGKDDSKCVLAPENYAAHIREMARLLTEGHTVLHCTASDLLSNAYLLRSKSTDKAGVVMDLQTLVRHIRYQADKLEKVAEVINQTELATK